MSTKYIELGRKRRRRGLLLRPNLPPKIRRRGKANFGLLARPRLCIKKPLSTVAKCTKIQGLESFFLCVGHAFSVHLFALLASAPKIRFHPPWPDLGTILTPFPAFLFSPSAFRVYTEAVVVHNSVAKRRRRGGGREGGPFLPSCLFFSLFFAIGQRKGRRGTFVVDTRGRAASAAATATVPSPFFLCNMIPRITARRRRIERTHNSRSVKKPSKIGGRGRNCGGGGRKGGLLLFSEKGKNWPAGLKVAAQATTTTS